MDDSDNVIFGK